MTRQREVRGKTNYHAGLAAEASIERHYVMRGHSVLARRWRGRSGEIDLIVSKDGVISFVEVKLARTLAQAADSLRPAQAHRIARAAEEFLGSQPAGSLTECTFDVGLADHAGACKVIENAFFVQ